MTMNDNLSAERPEDLIGPLLSRLAEPLSHPLTEDWLIVPGQGLEHWLTCELARGRGICSGLRWLQPEQALKLLLSTEQSPWPERGQLVWELLRLLDDLPDDPAFSLVRGTLEAGRSMDLAEQLAGLFENYALYRPELLRAWAQALPGPETPLARWQAWLWRALPEDCRLLQNLSERLRQELPERIQLFGSQQLPPLLEAVLSLPEIQGRVWRYLVATPALPQAPARAEIHAVAGPLRELEVLRDGLLSALEQQPDLSPDDILIAVPDLRAYAPLVPFVFGRDPALPVRIYGAKPLETGSALLQAFEGVLRLLDSRLPLSDVLALLELEPVARRFGLEQSERELCRHWLESVAVRWGWDAQQRQELTQVAFNENSWHTGLRRLLLGYLLPLDEIEQPVLLLQGIAPYPDLEGSQGQTLGKLLDFLDALAAARKQLGHRRGLGTWAKALLTVLARFTRPAANQQAEWELLIRLIDRLHDAPDLGPQSLSRVRSWLRGRLRELESDGHPGGGIRLAPINWCQGLPAKMICLLGLNDRSFPRASGFTDLNLLQREPQPGDPDPGLLDRQHFSSLLQSARERLWLSYQGISTSDGSIRPPSLLLTQLLESWSAWQQGPEIIRHPLYPYDPNNFSSDAPASFRANDLNLARRLYQSQDQAGPEAFCDQVLTLEPPPIIELPELLKFWRNPAAAFLRARLELGYALEREPGIDSEALSLDALNRHQLAERLLTPASGLEAEYARLVAQSRLPVGRLGRIRFEELANEAQHFARSRQRFEAGQTAEPEPFDLNFDLPLAGLRLNGELPLWPDGLRFSRQGKLRAQELLESWIQHLVLQLLPESARQRSGLTTRLLGRNEARRFQPVADASRQLETLLKLTVEGLQRPLAYFPRCSQAFAEARFKGQAVEQALLAAESAWSGRPGLPGEGNRSEWRVSFREDPLGSDFQQLAEEIWLPLLDALSDEASP